MRNTLFSSHFHILHLSGLFHEDDLLSFLPFCNLVLLLFRFGVDSHKQVKVMRMDVPLP